ncbi:sarcosine oxidase subunit gamma [Phaeovulum sp.]|uniref:sarcosine oxidase subunit gamma n=1 Tax=Phaeovulum sp. TaxID=2934796 RepID=UPI0039E36087
MSDPVSALQGQLYDGFAQIAETGLQGMITLRADLASKPLAKVLKSEGFSIPAQRAITSNGNKSALWMSPDEMLLLVPYTDAPTLAATLEAALSGTFALVADVSDARAMFRITGTRAAEVLAKLCPVDFETLAKDEVRRTRAAQVAAALWQSAPDEFSLISFRSVAAYVMGILEHSARPGSELTPT